MSFPSSTVASRADRGHCRLAKLTPTVEPRNPPAVCSACRQTHGTPQTRIAHFGIMNSHRATNVISYKESIASLLHV